MHVPFTPEVRHPWALLSPKVGLPAPFAPSCDFPTMLRTFAQRLFGGLLPAPEDRLRRAKLIACDIDGTLLNADEMIGAETLKLIRTIQKLGIHFILITRRHHQAAEFFAEDLRMSEPVISLDGAMARFLRGEILFTVAFDQEFALDIIDEIAQTDNVAGSVVTPDGILCTEPDATLPSHHQHWNIETTIAGNFEEASGGLLEIIASGSFHAVNTVFDYVNRKMRPGELKIKLYESHSRRELWHMEVRARQATKQKALERLIERYDITMREVIGIGDHYNDLDFCASAGYVVAVANAIGELKEMADFVTKRDCLDEGINEFLEYFVGLRTADAPSASTEDNPSRTGRRRSR